MIFSVAEVMLYGGGTGENQMEYGDYEFEYRDLGAGAGVLVTSINGQEIEFQNLPTQVGYIEVDPSAIFLMKNSKQIALLSDPNMSIDDASMVDYARLQLGLAIPEKAFNAMDKSDERYQLPVLNCSVATPQMPVVVFNMSNDTRITTDGYCVILHGQERDLMRLKDRVIFEYYNILDNGTVVDE